MTKPTPKPDWSSVTFEALRDPAGLARVLASMGFADASDGTSRWAWEDVWPVAYSSIPAKSPHRVTVAANNRARRDAPVIAATAPGKMALIDADKGEWVMLPATSQRGDDLASLGALMWGCRYGHAASRIARAIGLRDIPHA